MWIYQQRRQLVQISRALISVPQEGMITVLHSERSSRQQSEQDAFHINEAITDPAASQRIWYDGDVLWGTDRGPLVRLDASLVLQMSKETSLRKDAHRSCPRGQKKWRSRSLKMNLLLVSDRKNQALWPWSLRPERFNHYKTIFRFIFFTVIYSPSAVCLLLMCLAHLFATPMIFSTWGGETNGVKLLNISL